ncbi:MAG TPA: DUF6065 family protein, partial [Stellaceae bacterium]|nr:DUF6065 family protein [Stellaceae bacterium]
MKLTCFTLGHAPPRIRVAPAQRDWMDDTPEKFAYRCLPLNIANSAGWEILCPTEFTAIWDGGINKEAIKIFSPGRAEDLPISHFGSGVLTFHVNCLFRTEPGYNLFASGPVNLPKDGIQALTGLIETDWAPYTFTMNWRFTRAGVPIHFHRGEPFCFFFPVPRDLVEAVEPEFRAVSDEPEFKAAYETWQENRRKFNIDLNDPQSAAAREKWQKIYYVGDMPDGTPGTRDHRIKLRLREFVE